MKEKELALLYSNFGCFIEKGFYTLCPDKKYVDSWHMDYLADILTSVVKYKEGKRIIINMPPRSMKSTIVSVLWPAWLLGLNPSRRIIACSYSQKLSNKHSVDVRNVMLSDWYSKVFPETIISKYQNEKHKFQTTMGGFRLATSIGGTLTGEGGDILILDDPINPKQVNSKKYRDSCVEWFEQTFMTRLDDRVTGSVIIVMHRLHEDDLTGYLKENQGDRWDFISLPTVFEQEEIMKVPVLKKYKGDLLNSKFNHSQYVEDIKKELGSRVFATQYQQKPPAHNSEFVNIEWFKRYDKCKISEMSIVQSWDTANGSGEGSDYSVCTTWGISSDNCVYLIDVFRDKLDYDDLYNKVVSLCHTYDSDYVIIENKASGQQLIQQLMKNTKISVIKVLPEESKEGRFLKVLSIIESGRLYLPKSSSWIAEFEEEVMSFPRGKNDDMIDSTSQFLIWFMGKFNENNNVNVRII